MNTPHPRRILVVDDEPLVRESFKLMLEVIGHSVATVSSAAEALILFSPDRFDLVLTDYRMPGMTGLQLAQAIKASNPRHPVIMVTGYSPPEVVETVDYLIQKPVSMNTLRHAIEQACTGSALQRKPSGPAPDTK